MLDGERRGWVATPAVSVEAFSGGQRLAPASVALEGTTYAVTPAAVEVHAGIIAGEITGMRVVQRVERSSDRLISPPRLMGALRLWSSSETHSVRLVVAKIQYLDDQWRPTKLQAHHVRQRSPLRRSSPGSSRDSASRSATSPLLTGKRCSVSPDRSGASKERGKPACK